jgi:hypothetical protein
MAVGRKGRARVLETLGLEIPVHPVAADYL